MTWIPFNSVLSNLVQVYFLGEAPPSTFRLILCKDAAWDAGATMAQIIASEVAQTNGYSAPALTGGSEAYDSVQARSELAYPALSFTAAGGAIEYDDAVVLADAPSTRSRTIDAVDAAADRLTVSGHGLANDDKVMITADTGATLPTGLSGTAIYYAKAIDANLIELYQEEALTTKVTWPDTGSGSLRLRYANGSPVLYRRFDSTQAIADGATTPFEIYINLGGASADVESA